MSEFRKDALSDHWVIIAPNRAERPEQFGDEVAGSDIIRCPFCRGSESETPPPVLVYRKPRDTDTKSGKTSGHEWLVRVVPNKYPAVQPGEEPPPSSEDFYQMQPGVGVHEVIIESAEHVVSFSQLDDAQAALVVRAYRDRLRQLARNPRLAYAQVFKNSGAAAGASLEHAHSQLIATAVVPTQIQLELAKSLAYYQRHGHCVFCAMIERERSQRTRIVAETPGFVAFCPFASQFPYEVWILPREHQCRFESVEDAQLAEFASLVREVVVRTETALGRPAFNYLIHTAPFHTPTMAHFHWHLEFSPRLTKTAGFEWGAGDYINTVSPEDAACTLRRARP